MEEDLLQKTGLKYMQILETQGTVDVNLNGIPEAANFLIHYYFHLSNPKNKPNIALWRNVYSIIGLTDTNYEGLKKTLSQWHVLCTEENLMDQMLADTLKKYGAKIKLGVKEVATALSDTFVCGDYVGTIWYPPSFRKMWHEEYKQTKKITEFNLRHHIEKMVEEKNKITMIITKNEALADQIREKYMNYFNDEKK